MKHVLSILLVLVPLLALAQEATVKSVVADPMNISASKYPMTDLNGRTAPLVIVRVLADNVEFKGSVLDGGVQKKTGEYWVYMGAGAKMLHIHSDRFLPVEINFPDYGIPRLEPSTTYIVTLTLPQPAAFAPVSDALQQSAPVHLALCVIGKDNRVVYMTAGEWSVLSASDQLSYTIKGVCLSQGGETFLVELHDKEGGKRMDWDSAMKYNLPTKIQGEILAQNKDRLNDALRAFGGTVMEEWYWTKTDDDSSGAWYISMYLNGVRYIKVKASKNYVRAVVPVPDASARVE